MALSTKNAKVTARHLRVLGVGFGWATATSVLGVAVPLIYSAGSNEFSWDNPMKALGCTVTLVVTLATVGFLEKLKKDRFNVLTLAFLTLFICRPSFNVFLTSIGIDETSIVLGNIVFGWVACYFGGVQLEE